MEWIISGVLGYAAGFATCWFYRAKVEAAVVEGNKLSKEASDTVKKL